jgi:uncharacterized membrane protein
MTPILIALSYWLHALATVVFIGHFVLLAVIYLPALADTPAVLSAISKQSRIWMYASLLVFTITGILPDVRLTRVIWASGNSITFGA